MTGPLLAVRDLEKHFAGRRGLLSAAPAVRAVDGVSFDIARGETLGLVGESGCGKTTLARSLIGLERASGGSARFEGVDLFGSSGAALRQLRRRIQIVFQDPYSAFNPRLTVREIISEPWRVHPGVIPKSAEAARVGELLEQVGLRREYAERYPHEFSGGQRQRIGIARSLALDPDLIICDEPVSALDVSIQAQVVNQLIEVQRSRGVSFLFVAHDLAVVRHISHRVAVMYLGKIVEIGTREDIFARAAHPYTQALLSAVPVPDPSVRGKGRRIVLKGDPPSPVNPPSGCRFRTRCWKAAEICAREEPALVARTGAGHLSACHFPESTGPAAPPPAPDPLPTNRDAQP